MSDDFFFAFCLSDVALTLVVSFRGCAVDTARQTTSQVEELCLLRVSEAAAAAAAADLSL